MSTEKQEEKAAPKPLTDAEIKAQEAKVASFVKVEKPVKVEQVVSSLTGHPHSIVP